MVMRAAGMELLALPPRSPNLNAFAERYVKSIKTECLDRMILFVEGSLRHAVTEFIEHRYTIVTSDRTKAGFIDQTAAELTTSHSLEPRE